MLIESSRSRLAAGGLRINRQDRLDRPAQRAWQRWRIPVAHQQLGQSRARPECLAKLRADFGDFDGLVQERRLNIQRGHGERQTLIHLTGAHPGGFAIRFRCDYNCAG